MRSKLIDESVLSVACSRPLKNLDLV